MYKNIFKYDDMKRSEHMAVRKNVGWYFWTHQLIEITGPDVVAFLDHIYTGNIASLAVGRDRYTTMLNEQGEIIDDVVIMRVSEDTYWVSTLYATKADDWWYYHQGDYDVEWTEITEDWQMLAVQGPKSKAVIEALCADSVEDQSADGGNQCAGANEPTGKLGFRGQIQYHGAEQQGGKQYNGNTHRQYLPVSSIISPFSPDEKRKFLFDLKNDRLFLPYTVKNEGAEKKPTFFHRTLCHLF